MDADGQPMHTVERAGGVYARNPAYGAYWVIDGERWVQVLPDNYLGWPMPVGWHRASDWEGKSWQATKAAFDPLMSAVVQAIWEAHHERT